MIHYLIYIFISVVRNVPVVGPSTKQAQLVTPWLEVLQCGTCASTGHVMGITDAQLISQINYSSPPGGHESSRIHTAIKHIDD